MMLKFLLDHIIYGKNVSNSRIICQNCLALEELVLPGLKCKIGGANTLPLPLHCFEHATSGLEL